MSDRGDYRVWYASVLDDPDFQEMPGDVFKVLFALKMTLGAPGIGTIHRLVLAERTGCTLEELDSRLAELEKPKPDSDLGWIVRDRNIVWVVNGLRNERGLSPHSYHHRQFVEKQLKPLGTKKIVQDFRAYYAAWFENECPIPDPLPHTIEGADRGPTGGLEGGSDHYNQTTNNKNQETRDLKIDGDSAALSKFALDLIIRLNQGQKDNPLVGELANPVPHGHAPSLTAAEEILKAGVSKEFASEHVYLGAKKYKPAGRNRQINSLTYLANGVITAWEKEKARIAANGTSRPAVTQRNSENTRSTRESRSHAALADWLAEKETETVEVEVLADGQ